MAERHTIETYGTQPNNRNIWSTATERHTIETYGPQPNNRNIWQPGWRHAWPILLSAFQAPFIPLLTIDAQAFHNFTNMSFEKMPLLGAPLVPGPAVDMVLQSKANDLERAIRRLSILHTHDALVLLRN